MKTFREWALLNEFGPRRFEGRQNMQEYVHGGLIRLFHFLSGVDGLKKGPPPMVKLDPKKFGSNPITRGDVGMSSLPRIFFYLDPREKEPAVTGQCYMAIVQASDVYDLLEDPKGIKKKARERAKTEREAMDTLLRLAKKEGYKGVYYRPFFNCVNWFYPIPARHMNFDHSMAIRDQIDNNHPPHHPADATPIADIVAMTKKVG